MPISEPTIKRLWGKAAGHCSYPGCEQNCLVQLDGQVLVVIGEMAHVIAKKPNGPRGRMGGGEDLYENLILLCPSHHRLIDKAPAEEYPEETLLKWKIDHENKIEESLKAPRFQDRQSLNRYVQKRLIENHVCWEIYGPEGKIAKSDPNSGAGDIWPYRKLSLLVPNNRGIISAIKENFSLFSAEEYKVCCSFIEHAEGFEQGSIEPINGIPRFPSGFEELFSE